ncbi:MAG: glycosyltransferase family 2 protein [Chloroflexi bacterium]|nr:glycosyltransferase family 2 protein [Chloroflexota bacterium]
MLSTGTPDLSIIIVSYNTRALLAACLASLRATLAPLTAQTIVVDNASADGTAAMVAADFPEVTLIANEVNRGFAAANNQGLAISTGQDVLFLNPDTRVLPGAVQAALAYLRANWSVGAVGVRLLNGDGTLQPSWRRFYSFLGTLVDNKLTARLLGRDQGSLIDGLPAAPTPVDWVIGAFLLVRRAALARIGGGFDERFFVYGEEIDLQYALRAAGWTVVFLPGPAIVHYGGQSAQQVKVAATLYDYRSRYLFVRKHYPTPSVALYWLKAQVGLLVWWLLALPPALLRADAGARTALTAYGAALRWHLRLLLPGRSVPARSGGRL